VVPVSSKTQDWVPVRKAARVAARTAKRVKVFLIVTLTLLL
jgi:hypothetical protein